MKRQVLSMLLVGLWVLSSHALAQDTSALVQELAELRELVEHLEERNRALEQVSAAIVGLVAEVTVAPGGGIPRRSAGSCI